MRVNTVGAVAKDGKQNWNAAALGQPHPSHGSCVSRSSEENLIKLYYLNGLSASLSDSARLGQSSAACPLPSSDGGTVSPLGSLIVSIVLQGHNSWSKCDE